MMSPQQVDASYAFFDCPTLELLPVRKVASKHFAKSETPNSDIDIVTYRPGSGSKTHATEDWVIDTSYGYFERPTLELEPIHYEPKQIHKTPAMGVILEHERSTELMDGYSFFGV